MEFILDLSILLVGLLVVMMVTVKSVLTRMGISPVVGFLLLGLQTPALARLQSQSTGLVGLSEIVDIDPIARRGHGGGSVLQ